MNGKKAVVLLSGGLDSATVLAMAAGEYTEITCVSFSYGQRHTLELQKAETIAKHYRVKEHLVISLDPEPFRGSALTGATDVPENRTDLQNEIPVTYVPARNTVFLSIALGIAESRGADSIFIGVNSLDYSGYPDCRPEFIDAFQNLANLATKTAVEGNPPLIKAPLLNMTKAEIISAGTKLGVNYGMTLSCYQPDEQGRSCGVCDACTLRLAGFRESNITDPVPYRNHTDVR